MSKGRRPDVADELPPLLGRWPRLYAAVLAWLALLITLFYLFTRTYNR